MLTAEREQRGTSRLLAAVGWLDGQSVPVQRRLEVEVGDEFARMLVGALAGRPHDHGLRARALCLRGRSSP